MHAFVKTPARQAKRVNSSVSRKCLPVKKTLKAILFPSFSHSGYRFDSLTFKSSVYKATTQAKMKREDLDSGKKLYLVGQATSSCKVTEKGTKLSDSRRRVGRKKGRDGS